MENNQGWEERFNLITHNWFEEPGLLSFDTVRLLTKRLSNLFAAELAKKDEEIEKIYIRVGEIQLEHLEEIKQAREEGYAAGRLNGLKANTDQAISLCRSEIIEKIKNVKLWSKGTPEGTRQDILNLLSEPPQQQK